jgi:ATP-dependent Clp protease ATP-binding subunit ClpA
MPTFGSGNYSHSRHNSNTEQLELEFNRNLIGQPSAAQKILPFVEIFEVGLATGDRPAGVFLLLGPTGTGKTRTVESLAAAVHGSKRNILRIDCGEYQMEHEVARLIGAPPGYLGHRETQPMLSQARINAVASERSPLSILLFDEIEKAAPSLMRLLLGVLDRGILRLGDNNLVNLERTMIFMTSNLGAEAMQKELSPTLGFSAIDAAADEDRPIDLKRLEAIGLAAARRKFSPEFMNRIDAVITYTPLDEKTLATILDMHLAQLQKHVDFSLAIRAFRFEVTPKLRRFLLETGTSRQYGARELKRVLHRMVLEPLVRYMRHNAVMPGTLLEVDLRPGDQVFVRAPERRRGPIAA